MTIAARVLADSVNPDGQRLTTLEVRFPRFILAEFNTHRVFSRNSASSRAIPVKKQIERVEDDPFVPTRFPVNQPGMSTDTYYDVGSAQYEEARLHWLYARDDAVKAARRMLDLYVHKQIATRLLEPFMWHTVIVSATEWSNFFDLRISPHAQPEIRDTAIAMSTAMGESFLKNQVRKVDWGEYHLPLTTEEELLDVGEFMLVSTSVARCARVSYLTHDGRRDTREDLRLYNQLRENGHLSPFEHVARACNGADDTYVPPAGSLLDHGNFVGWHQHRKDVEADGVR